MSVAHTSAIFLTAILATVLYLTRTRADVLEETGLNRQETETVNAARERIMLGTKVDAHTAINYAANLETRHLAAVYHTDVHRVRHRAGPVTPTSTIHHDTRTETSMSPFIVHPSTSTS